MAKMSVRTERGIEKFLGDVERDIAGVRLGAAKAIAQAIEAGKKDLRERGFLDAHKQSKGGFLQPHPQGNRPGYVRDKRTGARRPVAKVYNSTKLMERQGSLARRFAQATWSPSTGLRAAIGRTVFRSSLNVLGRGSEVCIYSSSGGHAEVSGSVACHAGSIVGILGIDGHAGKILAILEAGRKMAVQGPIPLGGPELADKSVGQRRVVSNAFRRALRNLNRYMEANKWRRP